MQLDAVAVVQPEPLTRGLLLGTYSQISCGPYVESPPTLPPNRKVTPRATS
jgi:hypothetical protein